jgi:hypothetical protein
LLIPDNPEKIRELYAEAFNWYDPGRDVPPIHVSFYPYVGINHTIRVRSGSVYVRIGQICEEMPIVCHKGLAYILVGKLLRKRVPKGAREVYSAYAKSESVRLKAADSKKTRGRKVVTTSKGEIYDLDDLFDAINEKYFAGSIDKPVLTWSAKKTFRILGHHDATHDTVAISRSLDAENVPQYVVEYVLYHEMLHIHHPTKHINGRRYNHTAAFKRDERKFEFFEEAERWIERNVRKIRSDIKKAARPKSLLGKLFSTRPE